MSYEGDSATAEAETKDYQQQVLKKLNAIIFLLEIIADQDLGKTEDNI